MSEQQSGTRYQVAIEVIKERVSQGKYVISYKGRALHVLCGKLEAEEILIITGYEPSPEEWESDWKTRKER